LIGGVDLRGRAVSGSVREGRTVREGRADRPRARCSSRVLRVLALFRFRSVVFSKFWLCELSDGPRVPGGQSAGAWRIVRVLTADGPLFGVVTGGSVCFFGQSVAQGRTVHGAGADSPRQQDGQSAWPVRIVRPSWPDGPPEPDCFVPWFDSSLLSCFRVCFKESFLRLEVDP
jgi:hypothetical protein